MPLYRSARRKLKGKETHYYAVASVRLACFLTLDKWIASMRPCLLSFLSPEPLALANTLGSRLTGAGAVLVLVFVAQMGRLRSNVMPHVVTVRVFVSADVEVGSSMLKVADRIKEGKGREGVRLLWHAIPPTPRSPDKHALEERCCLG
ncbi:hypothetical protein IWZ01DRAFT_505727 [Phyllosticta capitalensis]